MSNESKFYSSQTNLIGDQGLLKLNHAKVLVVGAGGLGCPVLQYLGGMGIGHIGIIDNDKIELSNLHRQILYSINNIGEFKADRAASKIKELNPFIEIKSFTEKLDRRNITEIFKDYEIIVDCTDNFETKFLIHDFSFELKKILVQANIYQYEGNLHVFNFSSADRISRPCLRCLWRKEPEDGCIGTCADVGILGATAGVLGSLQAMEVAKIILGKKYLKNGEGLFIDLISHDLEKRIWSKNPDCSFCSNDKIIISENKSYQLNINEIEDDFIWIDLRLDEEVTEYTISKSHLIKLPYNRFNIESLNPAKKYLLICAKGYRSNQIARALNESGHNHFFSLMDGVQSLKRS